MKIRISIFEYASKKTYGSEPIKKEYSGIWALENMIEDLLKEYYGLKVTEKVMDFLRERIKGSEK